MEYKPNEVPYDQLIPQRVFGDMKGGISFSAMNYHFQHGTLDFVRIGNRRFVVNNDKAKNYSPVLTRSVESF